MKIGAEYAQRLKKLITAMKREGVKARSEAPSADDPLEVLLLGILSRSGSEGRATAALGRLRTLVVDINELRVTSVAELVEMLGADFPAARPVSETLTRVLISLYNRRHSLDLSFIKSMNKSSAENFLDSLDGLDPHAKALVLMRCLGAHTMPVDDVMLAHLRRTGVVPEEATHQEVQAFLERQIKHAAIDSFYRTFKRYAGAHAPRGGPARTTEPAVPARAQPSGSHMPSAPVAAPLARESGERSKPPRRAADKSAVRSRLRTRARAKRGSGSSRRSKSAARRR